MKLLYKESKVTHDEKLRGEFSNTLYQIDVMLEDKSKKRMSEAKDYTVKGAKVGRGDIQKLSGALVDLNEVTGGAFFSATDYTKPAMEYAEASSKMFGKDIQLYNLRPSTELDEEGRITKILITISIFTPKDNEIVYTPIFSENGKEKIDQLIKEGKLVEGKVQVLIENFYDENRNVITSLSELASTNIHKGFEDMAQGSFYLKGQFLEISGHLIELLGLSYCVPFLKTDETIEVNPYGKHKLLIRNQDGSINKLITDEEIKKSIKGIN
ncbi:MULTISPECIES: restriction endonuclease [unclassified Paenibacillus]|uniref:restriction endonuclease n=1 Tax=unclassified Paenibacillus TaxID=185978 RepID=UPI0008CE041D|nr:MULTISPECIES: restriction endonuclease [unclassified Paenibacillus]QLG42072.1 restriction endonuclease [Paenibacillus sp. E222]SEM94755.1 Restriction endonuclease [Paenibacillus sp. OK076]